MKGDRMDDLPRDRGNRIGSMAGRTSIVSHERKAISVSFLALSSLILFMSMSILLSFLSLTASFRFPKSQFPVEQL